MIDKLHINYGLIQKALDFYQDIGYTLINVNWMVEPQFSEATWSHSESQFKTVDSKGFPKHLVGSAEQGFIEEAAWLRVEDNKKYVSVTPCFRRGDNKSPVNHEWFMKVELNAISSDGSSHSDQFIHDAWQCFVTLGAKQENMTLYEYNDVDNTDIVHRFPQIDNQCPWLELGSYGTRQLNLASRDLHKTDCVVHYGTGLALPRFQLILP